MNKNSKNYTYIQFELWKLNRDNTTLTKELEWEEFLQSSLKTEHQELVKQISQLDQLIRTRENYIKSKEQKIIRNTQRIEELKQRTNPINK